MNRTGQGCTLYISIAQQQNFKKIKRIMKTSKLFTLAIAALALLSCTNEEPPAAPEAGRSKLTINIKGQVDAPQGRAAGTPTQADESKVNNIIVFVFKANGNNDITPKEYTATADDKLNRIAELEITTEAKEVYIIANTSSATETNAELKAITKKSELQAIIGRGFAGPSPTALPTQTSTNLWMVGKNDAVLTPVEGGNVAITVTLKYIAAKVRITSVTVSDEVVTGLSTKLSLENVIVLNGATATSFIPTGESTSLIPTYTPEAATAFYTGGLDFSTLDFANEPTIARTNSNYSYTLTGDKKIEPGTPGKNQQYFYVFENNGTAFESHPTIVTLKAMDDKFVEYYYSVFFKMDNVDTPEGYDNKVIERGNSYDIALTIKKWGAKDPTIPALKTTVDVTITPATWNTVTVDKTFE